MRSVVRQFSWMPRLPIGRVQSSIEYPSFWSKEPRDRPQHQLPRSTVGCSISAPASHSRINSRLQQWLVRRIARVQRLRMGRSQECSKKLTCRMQEGPDDGCHGCPETSGCRAASNSIRVRSLMTFRRLRMSRLPFEERVQSSI